MPPLTLASPLTAPARKVRLQLMRGCCAGILTRILRAGNRKFMAKMCMRSCNWCEYPDAEVAGRDQCVDEDIKCEDWSAKGECQKNVAYMRQECPLSCKVCRHQAKSTSRASQQQQQRQPPPLPPRGGPPGQKTAPAASTPTFGGGQARCADNDHRCEGWAKDGMCQQSAQLMRRTCPKACGVCGCTDDMPADCASMSKAPGACETQYMKEHCKASCGACFFAEGAPQRGSVRVSIDASGATGRR